MCLFYFVACLYNLIIETPTHNSNQPIMNIGDVPNQLSIFNPTKVNNIVLNTIINDQALNEYTFCIMFLCVLFIISSDIFMYFTHFLFCFFVMFFTIHTIFTPSTGFTNLSFCFFCMCSSFHNLTMMFSLFF